MILHQQKHIENECSHAHHKHISSGSWAITGQGRLEAKLGLFKATQHGERIHKDTIRQGHSLGCQTKIENKNKIQNPTQFTRNFLSSWTFYHLYPRLLNLGSGFQYDRQTAWMWTLQSLQQEKKLYKLKIVSS